MSEASSTTPPSGRSRPRNVRPALDDVDRRIVRLLADDARLPNNALAQLVGIAPSTCLGRVRQLRDSGVIRGYHADVDQGALGRPLQAIITVTLQAHARGQIRAFATGVASLTGVLNVYFLAGPVDFAIHLATASPANLRDFVLHLSDNPQVASTATNLVLDHIRSATGAR